MKLYINDCENLIKRLKNLIKDQINHYTFQKEELQQKKENEENEFIVFPFESEDEEKNIKKDRVPNCFYYTASPENEVSYEFVKSEEVCKKGTFSYNRFENLKEQIFFNALENAYIENIEVFKNLNIVKSLLNKIEQSMSDLDVKAISQELEDEIAKYNSNLKILSDRHFNNADSKRLQINNTLLPLIKSFDTRAVQIASHVPSIEPSYRRSQDSHRFHKTDAYGRKLIPCYNNEFGKNPDSEKILVTAQENEILYNLESNNKNYNQYSIYEKDNKYFLRDLDNASLELGDVSQLQERFKSLFLHQNTITPKSFKNALNTIIEESFLNKIKDIALYVKYKPNKKTEPKTYHIELPLSKKENIFYKLKNDLPLAKAELQAIFTATKEKVKDNLTQQYELNKFGSRVADAMANKGEAYNIGANASRVDKIIQYISNGFSSPQRNQSVLKLKDKILNHKNKVVKNLVEYLKDDQLLCLNVNKEQLKAKYPCLIITFKSTNVEITEPNNPENLVEGYSEFVTHMMIAQINLKLKQKNLSPLIDRRQSFGFLTPTLTEIHTGVRLSIGLTPNKEWIECVGEGIKKTDKLLNSFTFKGVEADLLNNFRGGPICADGHKYFYSLYKKGEISPEEVSTKLKNIKTSLDTKERIYFCTTDIKKHQKGLIKDGKLDKFYFFNDEIIILYDIENLNGKSIPVNKEVINDFIFNNMTSFKENKLIEEQEEWLEEAIDAAYPEKQSHNVLINSEYKKLYRHIMALYYRLIGTDELTWTTNNLNDPTRMTRKLIAAQNIAIEHFLKATSLITDDTSEEEDAINKYAKTNYYSPAGMSALFAPLFAAQVFKKNDASLPISYGSAPYTYFELLLSWNKTLDDSKFVRSDMFKNKLENHAFKKLLEKYSNGMDNAPEKIKLNPDEITICFKKIYKELFQNQLEGTKVDIDSTINSNEDEVRTALESKSDLINKSILLSHNKLIEILKEGINIILDSFPPYLNQVNVNTLEKEPMVYFVDNNPCVNKDNVPVIPAVDILKVLCDKGPYPKVFVLDTTSSTEEQIEDFLTVFNQQDKIPILVTAASMVKHNEYGLDLWQGGLNKVYLAAEAEKNANSQKEFESFTDELKRITKGTESGFGRFARRYIRQILNSIVEEVEPNLYETNKKNKNMQLQSGFTQINEETSSLYGSDAKLQTANNDENNNIIKNAHKSLKESTQLLPQRESFFSTKNRAEKLEEKIFFENKEWESEKEDESINMHTSCCSII